MVTCLDAIVSRIRERGPITVAELMRLALYDADHGYYATAARRSGRGGDFYTSVDVGPLFGEMIAVQLAEMWAVLAEGGAEHFELVEAGAGDGRLTGDILDAAARDHPGLYERIRVTLVECSPAARNAQRSQLGAHADRVAGSGTALPSGITGAIVANELLDAMPVHVVVMTEGGLREVFVTERNGTLSEVAGPLSSSRLATHLEGLDILMEPGSRAEIGLAAVDWVRQAAASISRGFLLLFDYGHEAAELYSATHAGGTLTAYSRHTSDAQSWLSNPGTTDLTTHVDLTSVRRAAEGAGLVTLGAVDQTYFLTNLDVVSRLPEGTNREAIAGRLAARTLLMPGGLGSTIKVLAFGKDVGCAPLRGVSGGRLT